MKIPCMPIIQSKETFWICKVKIKDILGRCRVDRQSPENPEGYQRDITKSRAKLFGTYIRKGGISPVNFFVNIRDKGLKYENGYLDIPDNLDWWLVDGQHRFEGLKAVIEEADPLRETEIPIALMNCNKIYEAKQFLIINKRQQGVKTDLAERILLLLEEKEGKESIALQDLPIDLWKPEALRIVDILTTDSESPLYNLIKRPGEKGFRPLNQVSVTSSLKPVIDTYKSYLKSEKLVAKALINMWGALKHLCPEAFEAPKDYVLLKTPGVFVMNKVFAKLLPRLWSAKDKDLTMGMFVKLFQQSKKPYYFNSDFWDRKNDTGAGKYGSSQKSYSIIFDLIWGSLVDILDEIIPEEVNVRI